MKREDAKLNMIVLSTENSMGYEYVIVKRYKATCWVKMRDGSCNNHIWKRVPYRILTPKKSQVK